MIMPVFVQRPCEVSQVLFYRRKKKEAMERFVKLRSEVNILPSKLSIVSMAKHRRGVSSLREGSSIADNTESSVELFTISSTQDHSKTSIQSSELPLDLNDEAMDIIPSSQKEAEQCTSSSELCSSEGICTSQETASHDKCVGKCTLIFICPVNANLCCHNKLYTDH